MNDIEEAAEISLSANLNREMVTEFPDVKPDALALLEQSPAPAATELRTKVKTSGVRRRNRYDHVVHSISRETHLRAAASTNNVELLQFYLEKGTNPNAADHYHRTALHLAAAHGYIDIINLLIQYKADPNVRDKLGNTPLHLASCGSGTKGLAIIKILLQAGTNVESLNSLGNNPMGLARSKLRILLKSSSSQDHSLAIIINDFQNILDLMIQYQKVKKENVDDLTRLSSRLATLSTNEDVTSEISTLLGEMDSLKL